MLDKTLGGLGARDEVGVEGRGEGVRRGREVKRW